MTEVQERTPPHHTTDRRTGVRYLWGGLSTAHCAHCHETFTSVDGFERHFILDQSTGVMDCFDPGDLKRRDGEAAFEKIDKPTWNPPRVWARAIGARRDHPHA